MLFGIMQYVFSAKYGILFNEIDVRTAVWGEFSEQHKHQSIKK